MMHQASVKEPRRPLLGALWEFVCNARKLPGVHAIALVGSLTAEKPFPKDADLLVVVDAAADIARLATLGRRLKGKAQALNLGADVFLLNEFREHIGRTCGYRECRPRVACGRAVCGERPFLCDDTSWFPLPPRLIREPPIELWPTIVRRLRVPDDVEEEVLSKLDAQGVSDREDARQQPRRRGAEQSVDESDITSEGAEPAVGSDPRGRPADSA